jgi:hypothetical protein
VFDAKLLLISKRDAPLQTVGSGAYAFWNSQVQQASAWNTSNLNNQIIPLQNQTEANCVFSTSGPYEANGPPWQGMLESFADAVLIKQYNGASGGNYVALDTSQTPPRWTLHQLNTLSPPFNYVHRVCSQQP